VNYPLLKTGLILDINNLYFAIQKKHGQRTLKITEYLKKLESRNHLLTYKIAYAKPESSDGFVQLLHNLGFETHFWKGPYSVAMALRVADIVPNVDSLILGTNSSEATRIFQWAKSKGKITKCFAADIPPFFRQSAECIEIPPEILNAPATAAKPLELHSNVNSDGTECTSEGTA